MNKLRVGGFAILGLLVFAMGGILGSDLNQQAVYAASYANDTNPNLAGASVGNSTVQGLLANASVTDTVTFRLAVVVHFGVSHGLTPSAAMEAKGYVPDCVTACIGGINYVLDPTVLVTDQGRDFEQCGIFKSSGTITCVSTDTADVLSVSVSSGYTPLHGDTACHATVQTSDGYSIVAGTVTPGAAGTTVTTTIAYTWTDTTASVSNIDLACIQTELAAGSHIILYAEGQIASTSTNVGDSLETIWTISRT